MGKTTLQAPGLTKAEFARKFKVDPKTVQEWIDQGRLDVVEYKSKEPFGRGGNEPVLILITSTERPPRKIPGRKN